MGLLEEAKKCDVIPTKKSAKQAVNAEELELAIAILTGEVTMRAAASALGMRFHTNARYWACTVLKVAHGMGTIDLHTLYKAPGASETSVETKEDPT